MSAFFEIAYAAASSRLCLFTGTGFSKAVTNNQAPSWQALLEATCDEVTNPIALRGALFPSTKGNPLSLEESAQVIRIELAKSGKSLHESIANQIAAISLSGDNSAISGFLKDNPVTVVTTNYDKLLEALADPDNCHSVTPGLPIPRSPAQVRVYHIHGSIDAPLHMVVTSDDYFRFLHGESYFSRKLSTLLHENTVVILGYSLRDTNLKSILSDYKGFSRSHVIGGNIFFVAKDVIHQHVKDYYAHSYGIRVLDQLGIHDFFRRTASNVPEAKKSVQSSRTNINKVLLSGHTYTENYLRIESSFFEIVASLAAVGRSIEDPPVVAVLGKIIAKKIELTSVTGAWEQYAHLARWLIHLGSVLELEGTSIKGIFLDAVRKSMTTMSKSLTLGYSWEAYNSWSSGWAEIIASNRALIRKHIETNTILPDALEIVRRG